MVKNWWFMSKEHEVLLLLIFQGKNLIVYKGLFANTNSSK